MLFRLNGKCFFGKLQLPGLRKSLAAWRVSIYRIAQMKATLNMVVISHAAIEFENQIPNRVLVSIPPKSVKKLSRTSLAKPQIRRHTHPQTRLLYQLLAIALDCRQ